MSVWQWLHFRFGLPRPLMEPLAVERICIDNYFSSAKARRDLGHEPPFTTAQALDECLPFYTNLFDRMRVVAKLQAAPA